MQKRRAQTVDSPQYRLSRYDVRMIAEEVAKEVLKALQPQKAEEYLTTKEAAQYARCSISKIYHDRAEIPHIKDGRLKFTKSGLTEWMKKQ